MSDPFHTFQFGAVKLSACSIADVVEDVRRLLMDRSVRPRLLLDVNAHIYNLATQDPDLARVLNSARVVMADGMGVVWAARLFGERIPERCNETEVFRAFLADDTMPPSRGIIAGTTDDEARQAAETIHRVSKHLRITRTASGYLKEDECRTLFREAGAFDFILLGHSTPITQRVAEIAVQERPDAIVWGIGAGTIKILAGTLKEAPAFWRKSGLQWLYRLAREPGSLWKRYVLGNPLFVARVIKARMSSHRD